MDFARPIAIKTRREIELMRTAGRHVAEILLELRERAVPGVTTGELDTHARRMIRERGVVSSFEGYGPTGIPKFPAAICSSVNAEVVHGIPGTRQLQEGDLLSLDFGVAVEGYHGDSAVTIAVGETDAESQRLMKVTREALVRGIAEMAPGHRLSDIGHAVESGVEETGFSIVREFVGHGIGRALHEAPQIPNYGPKGRGPRLRAGMVFAVEPMINAGGREVQVLQDHWTAVTADGSRSAHFEHTILITDHGPEVLTRVPGSH